MWFEWCSCFEWGFADLSIILCMDEFTAVAVWVQSVNPIHHRFFLLITSLSTYTVSCFVPPFLLLLLLFAWRYRTVLQDSFSEQPDSPILHSLHWLPVEQRIEYKMSSLCFKIISHQAPMYLSELLHLYTPSHSRQLRSSADTRVFRTPSFPTKFCGQRSFSYQAPVIWNQLPVSVHHSASVSSVKSSLKTFLFLKTSVSSFKSSLKTFLCLKTFSSVQLLWYMAACACVHVCVCVCVCTLMHACVCGCMCVCVCVPACVCVHVVCVEFWKYVHLKNVSALRACVG